MELSDNELLGLIITSNVSKIEKLIKSGTLKLNRKIDGESILIASCKRGERTQRLSKYLMDLEETEINDVDKLGNTALMWSCFKNDNITVKNLLTKDQINVNHQNENKETALMYAIDAFCNVGKTTGPINFLLKKENIDINLQDNQYNTALMRLCKMGDLKTLKIFMKRKDLKINLKTNHGVTAFMFSVVYSRFELVTYFLDHKKEFHEKIDLSLTDNYGQSMIGELNRSDYENMIKILERATMTLPYSVSRLILICIYKEKYNDSCLLAQVPKELLMYIYDLCSKRYNHETRNID